MTIVRNAKGQPTTVTDKKGNVTTYGYNANNELVTITPEAPLGQTVFTYDALSRIQTVKDGKNQTTTVSYDALDRTKRITFADAKYVEFTYDHNGNVTSRFDSNTAQTFNYSYDKLNRRVSETRPGSVMTSYVYDPIGNLTKLTDPGGDVDYTYDDGNRLNTVKAPGEATATDYDYDSRGNVTKQTLPNGVVTDQTFDASNKVKTIEATKSGAQIFKRTYTYTWTDAQGAREGVLRDSELSGDGRKTTYSYDKLERLDRAIMRNNSTQAVIHDWDYDHDAATNRTKQVIDGTTTTFAYNKANQLCWRANGTPTATCTSPPAGAVTYAYDANGNETSTSEGRAGSYNNRNQASSLTAPSFGARAQTYGGPNQFEWLSNGGIIYSNDLLGVGSEKDGTGAARYFTRTPTGTVIGQREAGGANRYYVHPDALGSTVNVTNSSGVEQADWEYDPYGQLMSSSTGNPPVNWRYAGQYRSEPLSLYKMGHRFYDPKIGRWTQQDPIDQSGDLREGNRYGYVGGDPVNLSDPSGLCIPGLSCKNSWSDDDEPADYKRAAGVGASCIGGAWAVDKALGVPIRIGSRIVSRGATTVAGCAIGAGGSALFGKNPLTP